MMTDPEPKQAHPDVGTGGYGRACDACRQHKVRCLPGTEQACQRCARTRRQCAHTAPQKRKQRKRTDTRVTDLERQVEGLKALLDRPVKKTRRDHHEDVINEHNGIILNVEAGNGDLSFDHLGHDLRQSNGPSCSGAITPNTKVSPRSEDSNPITSMSSTSGPLDAQSNNAQYSPDRDIIDRGILTHDQAAFLLRTYNEYLVNHYPLVIFPPETTASSLRAAQPTLFLAVMAAASGKYSPRLYNILYKEIITAYAHRTIIGGEKSLELVQAMLITCVWYNPPGKYALLKCYEYMHMAMNMAMDIGLGTNPRSSRSRRETPAEVSPLVLSESELANRRTFLFCYMISSSSSMTSKRPNMLRYNSWIEECLISFETLPGSTVHDKIMVAWAKLTKISEEINASLALDDLGNISRLSEPRVQLMVNGFDKTLQTWRRSVETLDRKDTLLLAYHHIQINLHELSLHDDHLAEDFRPPFLTKQCFTINLDPAAKAPHIESTAACVSHVHSLFDIFLGISLGELCAAPVLTFVRVMYGCVVLTKLYISSKTPESKIGAFLQPHSLKLGYYLEAIIQKLRDTAGPMECRAPMTFVSLITWLDNWYKGQVDQPTFSTPTTFMNEADGCAIPPLSTQSEFADPLINGELLGKDTLTVPDVLSSDLSAFQGEGADFDLGIPIYDGPAIVDPAFEEWNAYFQDSKLMDDNFLIPEFDWSFLNAASMPPCVHDGTCICSVTYG